MRFLTCFLLFFNVAYASYAPVENAFDVAVAWEGRSNMAERILSGFEERMQEIMPNLKYRHNKEVASVSVLEGLIDKYQKRYDAMLILRSSGAKLLGKIKPTIPSFIGATNDPKILGAVKNLNAPEGNITGVTYALDVEKQFEVFKKLFPKVKSIALISDKDHPASLIDHENTERVTKELGIKYTRCNVNSIFQLVPLLPKEKAYDFVILGSNAKIIDNVSVIAGLVPHTPLVSYSSKAVSDGALVGLAADDFKLGKKLAESVYDVLVNKMPISKVAVKVDDEPTVFLNEEIAKKFKIKIPSDLKYEKI